MIRKPVDKDTSRTAEIHVYGWRTAYKGLFPDDFLYKKLVVGDKIESHKNLIENSIEIFDIYEDENDGIIKGMILHGEPRVPELENAYELYAIYVEPLFQGEGVGCKLLKYVEKNSKEKGKSFVFLWVLEDNDPAIKFYEKNGYSFDCTIKVDDEWG